MCRLRHEMMVIGLFQGYSMTSNLSCKGVDARSESQKKIGPKPQTTNRGFCRTRLVVEHQDSVLSCESEPTWVQMGWRPATFGI